MICWSCDKKLDDAALCAHCGVIQPPDLRADHFQVLAVDRRFDQDLPALERRYKDQTRMLHPDRWTKAEAQARRFSLQRSVQLNDAWKTLRDPVKRAEYLLGLSGIDVGGEQGTTRTDPDGGKVRVEVPKALLMDVLELREELMEARQSGEHARVAALGMEVREQKAQAMAAVAAALAASPPELSRAADRLVAVRYYDRFLEEVDVHEEARFDGAGVGHVG